VSNFCQAALGPGVYSASNRMNTRNRKKNVSGGRAQLARDNLAAICEPIVQKIWDP
jgi:hypothetical protein